MSLKLIDRGRLKEINHRLLLGHKRHPAELKPLVDSFAEAMLAEQHPPRRPRRDRPRQGRRAAGGDGHRQLPLLRPRNRRAAGLRRLHRHQFDPRPRRAGPRQDRRRELLRPGQAPDDRGVAGKERPRARPCPLLFGPCQRRAGVRMGGRAGRGQSARPAGEAGRRSRLAGRRTGARRLEAHCRSRRSDLRPFRRRSRFAPDCR